MSGRKYSKIELANNIREAISCQQAAEQALTRAESLAEALNRAAATPALRSSAEMVNRSLQDIRGQLSGMRSEFKQSRMMRLDPAEIRRRRQAVQNLINSIEEAAGRCRQGADAAAARVELSAIFDQLQRSRPELEPWLRDIYDGYVQRTQRLMAGMEEEISRTGGAGTFAGRLPEHAAEFDAMRLKASERRARDAERQYIAYALKKVCAEDLGFAAELLPQRDPLEDLVVEVDTFAYGILHFRIQLDGNIRSQSELAETTCRADFGVIEEKLKSLGVISAFKYEDTQLPVRLQKGAKGLPDSEPLHRTLETKK